MIQFVEEAPVLTYVDQKAPDKWVHLYASILKNGRTEHVAPPGAAEPEAALEKEKEADPYIDRLRAIAEDESPTRAYFSRVRPLRDGLATQHLRGRAAVRTGPTEGGYNGICSSGL